MNSQPLESAFNNILDNPQIPANIVTEQALLGVLLTNNSLLFSLPTDLKAVHFYEPLHQRIFTAICNAIERGATADPFTLMAQFDADQDLIDIGGSQYLIKLASFAVSIINAPECAKVIIELSNKRSIINSCIIAIRNSYDSIGEISSGEIAASLVSGIENGALITGRFRLSTERQVTERLLARIKEQKPTDFSSTNFLKLNEAMGGGMYAGKLYGIVGRKKFGKTMLAGTISNNLQKNGTKHLYIALEMGSDEIHQRNMARELGIYESDFRTGITDQSRINKLAEYAVKAQNNRFYLDSPGIAFADLRQVLPMYIRRFGIKGFILDCWQLVGGKERGQSTSEHLDAVAQWLAETVKRYGVWGLVTAQQNQDDNTRGGEGIRLACDQLYQMCKKDESSKYAWLNMMETRYTRWLHIGSENNPALQLNDKCTHFEEINYA